MAAGVPDHDSLDREGVQRKRAEEELDLSRAPGEVLDCQEGLDVLGRWERRASHLDHGKLPSTREEPSLLHLHEEEESRCCYRRKKAAGH